MSVSNPVGSAATPLVVAERMPQVLSVCLVDSVLMLFWPTSSGEFALESSMNVDGSRPPRRPNRLPLNPQLS